MNKEEALAKASKELMLKEPFYGLFLMSLNKQWSTKINTAAVSLQGINYYLLLNEEFFMGLEHHQRVGILKHELLHIAFFHLTDFNHYPDQELMNYAMDIEINQYVGRENLPEKGVFFEDYKDKYNLEATKGSIYYYEKLVEEKKNGDDAMNKIIEAMKNGESSVTLPDGTEVNLPQHIWEEAMEQLSEVNQKLVRNQTVHIVNQVADQVVKSRGTIPGEIKEILDMINQLEPAKFDWKGYMRRFYGKSITTYSKKSRRKPNVRMPDLPGFKFEEQKHILVGIDTSGSVSTNELKEFLNEMHHMKKTGAEVTIVQCDTSISDIRKFNPHKEFEVKGRGGTSFQPVIDYYNENERHYSCLFYLTDGEAPSPENARGNILWVLSSQSQMNDKLPGQVIKLDI